MVDEQLVVISGDLVVRSIRVRNNEVSLFDAEGRECILVARQVGGRPGAGLEVQVGDHVAVREMP